ncbi:MAG: relaxase/mobilization nuclease domain-containing protein [Cetobacterium sp.]|uniref:relaxase/mobilization nuclease domain-containing protein n=1 Tax=Cetobacterium sp. TaxID=2071632 RepID=UPI002FC7ED3D
MAIIKCLPGTKSLKNQLKYLEKEGKTSEELKDGINCTTDNVEKEFNIVKEMYNKKEGKQYYHYTQAFNPEDKINPEKAHEIGREWIEKNIKGHQIYMVTHVDKEHIHNHFLINSVSIEDGKKLQINPKKLEKMKIESNRICEREGLTKINLNKKNEIFKTDGEYRIEKRGQETWKGELREVIELELKNSKNLEEFRENLKEKYDVETRVTKNTISYKHPTQKKSVRGKRLGENYTKESVLNEFNKQADRTISEGNNRGREKSISERSVEGVKQNKQTRIREQSSEGNLNRVYGSIGEIEKGAKQFSIKAREEEQGSRKEDEEVRREQQNARKEREQRAREDRGKYKSRGFNIER